MRPFRLFIILLLAALCSSPHLLFAQKEKREPLTEAQIEQIREAGIAPPDRINLYTKFLNERADTIKSLTNRSKSLGRGKRLDDELQDLTALMDELGSNLDTFADRHADIRKSLKPLADSSEHWLGILRALPGEPSFDLARKEAIESGDDLASQAKRLLTEQNEYFKQHKDEAGQDRAEPNQ